MVELIDYFLHDLQERVNKMTTAFEAAGNDELRMLAHQLKGAAGGYGYPTITTSAAELESALKTTAQDTSAITTRLDALVNLCRQAVAGGESR